jgi:ribosome-associated protein
MTDPSRVTPVSGGGDGFPSAVLQAAELALERKADDVVALDLRSISTATDFFVLATGNSDIQVRAIAEHVLDEMAKGGLKPMHVEGLERARWVLLDFVDFVVHVFHPLARDFYQLELLWGDAPARAFSP